MKKFFLLLSFFPTLLFAQVKLGELTQKNGLAFEKDSPVPFTGQAYDYYPDGSKQTMMEFKDGLGNGELKNWDAKGGLQVEGFVSNGQMTGVWKLYYESGKLKKQSTYSLNHENGEEIFWFENGNLEKKGSYIDGKLNGAYEWYYENGQKQQEGYFINGQEDSTWSEWHENGKPKMKGQYVSKEKSGEWTWWDEQGNVTTTKTYLDGLVQVKENTFDSYLEKMEYYISRKNFKESLKNIELAEATITDKTENNPIYMDVAVYYSKCYTAFFHYTEGERLLLSRIGLTAEQIDVVQNVHTATSPEKINKLIEELNQKDKSHFQVSNHVALALCYNLLADSVNLKEQQQLMMEKGGTQDWIINMSLELYKLADQRFNNHYELQYINDQIKKEGANEKLELDKALNLLRSEDFEGAQKIVDRYLQANDKNLRALLLKADIEMALGNVENMKAYEQKAVAIDPDALSQTMR